MAVKPAFRRQGVASSLLRAVDGMAHKMGAAYLCLFCELGNRGAVRLYEQAGYHAVGSSPSVGGFAGSLGLPASKVYGFFYRPLFSLQQQQQQHQQQRRYQQGDDDEEEEAGEEEEYEIAFPSSGRSGGVRGAGTAAGNGPSRWPGQPGLLNRVGQRAFSWW